MNIYDFFNSRDIAKHCHDIDHKFTATEMAYLVWYSDHHTIAQKHAAWNYIIENMPDEAITQFGFTTPMMLHDFLRKYMALEQKFVQGFVTTKPGHIYSYEVRYPFRLPHILINSLYTTSEARLRMLFIR